MKKRMSIFLAVIIVIDIIALGVIFFGKDSSRPDISTGVAPNANTETTQQAELFSRVTFAAVGDNLIHDTVYEQAAARSSGGYDFTDAYERIADYIAEPDVAILNQETIISTEHNVSSYPMFNSPVEVGEEMLEIGFDVFNIATNHSLDCGEKGLVSAINFWKSKNAVTCGAYLNADDMSNIPVNEVNGVKIAYLGFTDSANGLSLPEDSEVILVRAADESLLQQRIIKAKEIADVVIVSAHWGNEYTHEPTDAQRELAEKLAMWGADVIIGTHPHVIQPVEYITNRDGRKTLVAYSLGNFISAQNRGPRMLGGMLNFEIVKNNTTGEIALENVKFSGVVTHFGYGCSNIRVYPLEAYTEELASKHGVLSKTSDFSLQYLYDILNEVIDKQFLK
ncbi:MAG: CapA family protein [Acutalibacteraceae bacterium]|nr:CapA family protein [Acutalibacteraceae bacterium]